MGRAEAEGGGCAARRAPSTSRARRGQAAQTSRGGLRGAPGGMRCTHPSSPLRRASSSRHPLPLPLRPLLSRYLALQDVPRTTDHAPSRTFYTWRVNVDAAIRRVASDLYRAAGNVHARCGAVCGRRGGGAALGAGPWRQANGHAGCLQRRPPHPPVLTSVPPLHCAPPRMLHELERRKELLELVEEDNQQSAVVAERRGDELESLKRVSGRLEAALLDLDRQICIFADV